MMGHRLRWPLPRLMTIAVGAALVLMLSAASNPNSEIPIPHSAFRIPHSIPVVRAVSGAIPYNGGTTTLPVEVAGVQNLGAATVVVGYDPAVLKVAGCQRNSAFDVGLCNAPCDRDEDGTPDAVVCFNVNSLTGLSAPEGEPLNLVDITWQLVGQSDLGITRTLAVEVPTFTDVDAIPLSRTAEDGVITVTGRVRINHVMTVAAQLGQPAGTGNAQYNLVRDAVIDAQDLAVFAAFWRDMWP